MSEIVYASSLSPEHRERIVQILFFNAHQAIATKSVAFVAERYGLPRVTVEDERLRVGLAGAIQTQTLFAVLRERSGEHPVGVVVYTREGDALVVLYVAVHEDFSSRGPRADRKLLIHMTKEIRAIARRVKGVDSLLVYLGRSTTPTRVRVGREPS